MVDEGAARAVRSGLLVAALAATGVGEVDVAPALAAPGGARLHRGGPRGRAGRASPSCTSYPTRRPTPRRSGRPRSSWTRPRRSSPRRRQAAQEAADEVEQLEARSLQLQAELDELRRKISELETAQEENDDELSDAEDVRSEADDTVREAERAVAAARAELDRLSR